MKKNLFRFFSHDDAFYFSNPLPYNPDTRLPLPEGVEFYEYDYRVQTVLFKMNEKQILGYDRDTENYFVTSICNSHTIASCHLEPCTYGELKEGDFFVFNKEVYLKASPHDIKPLVDGGIKITTSTDAKLPVNRVVRDNQ